MSARHLQSNVLSTALVFVLLPVLAWAQSFNGSIGGTVKDPSGAVVPSAELTLTSVGTGTERKMTTGPDGLYLFWEFAAGGLRFTGFRQGIPRLHSKGHYR